MLADPVLVDRNEAILIKHYRG